MRTILKTLTKSGSFQNIKGVSKIMNIRVSKIVCERDTVAFVTDTNITQKKLDEISKMQRNLIKLSLQRLTKVMVE